MDENGLYAMLAQVFRLAIRDAQQTQNRTLSQEARRWLWDVAPYIARKGDVPRPEGEAVTVSISSLLWVTQLPVFTELVVMEDGRLELCQSFNAETEQELRGALLKYRSGDRLAVKRLPSGWNVEITRRTSADRLKEAVKVD
jgi:hypothetical protein